MIHSKCPHTCVHSTTNTTVAHRTRHPQQPHTCVHHKPTQSAMNAPCPITTACHCLPHSVTPAICYTQRLPSNAADYKRAAHGPPSAAHSMRPHPQRQRTHSRTCPQFTILASASAARSSGVLMRDCVHAAEPCVPAGQRVRAPVQQGQCVSAMRQGRVCMHADGCACASGSHAWQRVGPHLKLSPCLLT